MITKIKSKALLLAVSFSLVACGSDDDNDQPAPTLLTSEDTIATTVSENESFSTLLAAVDAADLVETLDSEGPFTVFAPTDEAFAALPEGTLDSLLLPENKQKLIDILLFHVVPGSLSSSDVLAQTSIATVFGQNLAIDKDKVTVNGASIVSTDIAASNGTIHVIDSVLIPKDAVEVASSAGFNTLVAAIEAAGLTETLKGDGPFTIFAPTDDAFAALPEGTLESLLQPENKQQLIDILSYHVVSGSLKAEAVLAESSLTSLEGSSISISSDGGAKVNESSITATDVIAGNGVIHVIDKVLIP
ncbi:MAG: fasciclin domain-containing protein [Pseudobacteriovorax sp.]|nr:fasciclin domain-containing protein [Pseudobacteriovorax sp.]